MAEFNPPEGLRVHHELQAFDSGVPELDAWLMKRALHNETEGASRTYVVCEAGSVRVVAYYSLAVGGVQHTSAPGKVRRNMPDPIPVMVLGRLAVDRNYQKKGLGRGLLREAVLRTTQAADIAGIRALLVHAISDQARTFYENAGFKRSPLNPYTLMLVLSEAKKIIGV